ncbi:hypothetical protein RHMOL_Rhmol08G0141900 [Rhododendron molle]|uniref:Uncharacterized protein n=1 Tax=Rhododendron molle TaxID=49168 RepID=A0ACC0MNZ8_RHOML|nr:hypothetical protein RHMOL_Rhmol08G0141900 [Rhododendron molle]
MEAIPIKGDIVSMEAIPIPSAQSADEMVEALGFRLAAATTSERRGREWGHLEEQSTPSVFGSVKPAKPWIASAAASKATTTSRNSVVLTVTCLMFDLVSRHRTLMNVFDKAPVVDKDAFVAPSASLIGDVLVGRGSSIWYGCVLRGYVWLDGIKVGME